LTKGDQIHGQEGKPQSSVDDQLGNARVAGSPSQLSAVIERGHSASIGCVQSGNNDEIVAADCWPLWGAGNEGSGKLTTMSMPSLTGIQCRMAHSLMDHLTGMRMS